MMMMCVASVMSRKDILDVCTVRSKSHMGMRGHLGQNFAAYDLFPAFRITSSFYVSDLVMYGVDNSSLFFLTFSKRDTS